MGDVALAAADAEGVMAEGSGPPTPPTTAAQSTLERGPGPSPPFRPHPSSSDSSPDDPSPPPSDSPISDHGSPRSPAQQQAKMAAAPPFIKVPTDPELGHHHTCSHPSLGLADSDFLSGPFRHFISPAQFSAWQRNNPLDRTRLRPRAPSTGNGSRKDKVGSYEPPKHPAADVLHNIPSRRTSSRCNIVDWMLWLASNERREAGRIGAEMRKRAEAKAGEPAAGGAAVDAEDAAMADISDDDEEEDSARMLASHLAKAKQLSSQARSMLAGSPSAAERRHLSQPPFGPRNGVVKLGGKWSGLVEKRRVFEDAVSSLVQVPSSKPGPSPAPVNEEDTPASGLPKEVETLLSLSPPLAANASPAPAPTDADTISAARSLSPSRGGRLGPGGRTLLAQKLAAEEAAHAAASSSSSNPSSALPPPSLTPPSTEEPVARGSASAMTPHDDYRILYSDRRRKRADAIFSDGVAGEWCTAHRIRACTTCAGSKIALGTKKGGDGKEGERTLAGAIPALLVLSAEVLRRYERQVSGLEEPDESEEDGDGEEWEKEVLATEDRYAPVGGAAPPTSPKTSTTRPKRPVLQRQCPDGAWYAVLTSVIVQALLDGYLLHGWKGAACVEVLCGLGAAGAIKGWRSLNARDGGAARKDEREGGEVGEESGDEEAEEERRRREEEEQERERKLVEAAKVLFGAGGAEKGEYERIMRDIAHEFFDVPEGSTLSDHLDRLSIKYPRSVADETVLDWLEAVDLSLGKPELAKYEERAAVAAAAAETATPSSLASASAQLHGGGSAAGLEKYFSPLEWDEQQHASSGAGVSMLGTGVRVKRPAVEFDTPPTTGRDGKRVARDKAIGREAMLKQRE